MKNNLKYLFLVTYLSDSNRFENEMAEYDINSAPPFILSVDKYSVITPNPQNDCFQMIRDIIHDASEEIIRGNLYDAEFSQNLLELVLGRPLEAIEKYYLVNAVRVFNNCISLFSEDESETANGGEYTALGEILVKFIKKRSVEEGDISDTVFNPLHLVLFWLNADKRTLDAFFVDVKACLQPIYEVIDIIYDILTEEKLEKNLIPVSNGEQSIQVRLSAFQILEEKSIYKKNNYKIDVLKSNILHGKDLFKSIYDDGYSTIIIAPDYTDARFELQQLLNALDENGYDIDAGCALAELYLGRNLSDVENKAIKNAVCILKVADMFCVDTFFEKLGLMINVPCSRLAYIIEKFSRTKGCENDYISLWVFNLAMFTLYGSSSEVDEFCWDIEHTLSGIRLFREFLQTNFN